LFFTVFGAPVSRALYIAPRTDNKPGNGTLEDPFDGSDPGRLWQAWLKTAFRKDGVGNQTIVFLPGVYSVTNELRLPYDAKEVTLSGYGARLVFTDQAVSGQRTVLSTAWRGNDHTVMEGFTIDCGTAAKFTGKNGKVQGLFSKGRNNVVRDVTIRNTASYNRPPHGSVYEESFGIILDSEGGLCSGNSVTGTGGGESQGVTGISLSGNDCSVTGNVVDFRDHSASNGVTSFGFSLYGSGIVMNGNVARGVDAGISMDGAGTIEVTNTWQENVISGNLLAGNQMAVRIHNNSQTYKDWLWIGNNFRGSEWLSMWTNRREWLTNKISGQRFVGNMFTGSPRSKANMTLMNFQEPHSFIGNSFTVKPDINVGKAKNTFGGFGNTIQGTPDDRPFGGKQTR
jgi:hypothetical protein